MDEKMKTEDKPDIKFELERFKITLDFLKFEATTLWQIFSAFFVAHALLLNSISTLFTKSNGDKTEFVFMFILSISGFILALLWLGTFHGNSKWYYFRMIKQAKPSEENFVKSIEDDKWFLLNKEAEEEAKKMSPVTNKFAGYGMISIFLMIYILIIGWSLFKMCCDCQ
jgi:hypothetical protein